MFRERREKKGAIEWESFACAFCHTRVMPDGGILKGAQGNFPFDRVFAFDRRTSKTLQEARFFQSFLYARRGCPLIHKQGFER